MTLLFSKLSAIPDFHDQQPNGISFILIMLSIVNTVLWLQTVDVDGTNRYEVDTDDVRPANDCPRCVNCGNQVTRQFARVFGDNRDVVHACPDCATYRDDENVDFIPEERR